MKFTTCVVLEYEGRGAKNKCELSSEMSLFGWVVWGCPFFDFLLASLVLLLFAFLLMICHFSSLAIPHIKLGAISCILPTSVPLRSPQKARNRR